MSLLDKFVLLFETDASKSSEDVKKFNKVVDESEDSAESAAEAVDGLVSSVKNLAIAYIGLSAIKGAVFDMASADDVVAKFSNTLGFNIEQIDAYGAAVERSGGSADSFRASIAGMKSQLDELQNYGGGEIAQTLARIGINAATSTGKIKNAMDLLPELADKFSTMSAGDSDFYGKKLGLDQGTILLLQQSRYGMAKLVEQQRQYGHRTKDSTLAAENFNDAMDNSRRLYDSVAQKINEKLLPVFTNLINFFIEHKSVMLGFFTVITGYILASMIPAVLSLNKAFAANPILRVITLLFTLAAAFGLVYEDIKFYMNGQDSMIGRLFKKYAWLKDGVMAIGKAIMYVWNELKKDIDWMNLLFTEPQKAIDKLKSGFMDLYNYIINLFSSIGSKMSESISDSIDSVKRTLGIDVESDTKAPAAENNDAPDLPNFGSGRLLQNTQKGLSMQSAYGNSPVNNMNKSATFNSNNSRRAVSVNIGDIKIDASNMSASEAKTILADTLKNQISDALGYLNDGVVA